MSEAIVKYRWQMGPFRKSPRECSHRSEIYPHSDLWQPFYCDGDRDKCLCPDCGAVHEHACSFDDDDYK